MCMCVYIYKVKLATFVESSLKASFSIATTLRCTGGHYSFHDLYIYVYIYMFVCVCFFSVYIYVCTYVMYVCIYS